MTDSVVIYGNYHHGLHRGSITMYKSKFVWMSKTVYIERSNFFRPEKQRETVMAVANIYKHLLYTIYTKKTISQNRSKIDYVPLLALRPGWEEEPNSPEEPRWHSTMLTRYPNGRTKVDAKKKTRCRAKGRSCVAQKTQFVFTSPLSSKWEEKKDTWIHCSICIKYFIYSMWSWLQYLVENVQIKRQR